VVVHLHRELQVGECGEVSQKNMIFAHNFQDLEFFAKTFEEFTQKSLLLVF